MVPSCRTGQEGRLLSLLSWSWVDSLSLLQLLLPPCFTFHKTQHTKCAIDLPCTLITLLISTPHVPPIPCLCMHHLHSHSIGFNLVSYLIRTALLSLINEIDTSRLYPLRICVVSSLSMIDLDMITIRVQPTSVLRTVDDSMIAKMRKGEGDLEGCTFRLFHRGLSLTIDSPASTSNLGVRTVNSQLTGIR